MRTTLTTAWMLLVISTIPVRGLDDPQRQENADEKIVAAAKDLSSTEEERRWLAAAELLGLGERARPALPELITVLREQPGELPITLILGQIGEPAVKPLVVVLQKGPRLGRESALVALSWIGPPAKEAIPALRELLKSDDANLVPLAAYALARIHPDSRREAIEVLQKGTGTIKGEVNVLLLAWLRPDDAGPAVFVLARSLRSQSCMFGNLIRLLSAYCLAELGPAAGPAAPALREALEDREPVVQVLSAYALAQGSPEDRVRAMAVLVKISKTAGQDPDPASLEHQVLQRQPMKDAQMHLTLASVDALLTREPGNRFPSDYMLRWAKRSLQQPDDRLEEWLRDNGLAAGLAREMVWRLDPEAAKKSGIRR